MSGYLQLLRIASARRLLLAAFLGRIPYGVEGVAVILFFNERHDSYAFAGAVAGALGLGIAVGSVAQGRWVDQRGPGAFVPLAGSHVLLVGLLILGGGKGWPLAPVVLIAGAAGATVPAASSFVRGLYPAATEHRADLSHAAFSLDAALTDATYVAGPAIASVLTLVADASLALCVGLVASVASVWLVTGVDPPTVRRLRQASHGLGALSIPGIRTLVMASVPMGIAYGVAEVALLALAQEHGSAASGGLLLTVFALTSAAAAVVYGGRQLGTPPASIITYGAVLYPFAMAVPLTGWSPVSVGFLLIPWGIVNGPLVVARNHVTVQVADLDGATEAFAWVLTSVLLGVALGNVAAGALIEDAGWRGGMALAAASALLMAATCLWRRSSLVMP